MSLSFYTNQEEETKDESYDKYKLIFSQYYINPPTLKEALEQMFISSGLSKDKTNQLISETLNKVNNFITPKFNEIKKKYTRINIDDAKIICSYTCEFPTNEKGYNIYKLLNTNMVAKNREEGLKNVSKYLFLLLNSLRKLSRSHYHQLYRCISALVRVNYDSFDNEYIPYLKGNQKTFWGFTSTSPSIKTCLSFLDKTNSKTGTIFSLIGDIWGYDITLFNICGEKEVLLEPERNFNVEESLPEINGIIYVRLLIKKSSIVLDNSLLNISPIIFSYIDNKTKLRIVKYNKSFQNKININILDYRRLSGKYILYETKGKGKEYNAYNDELLFEGEFLNGKRWNGKGKEYGIINEYLNYIKINGIYIQERQCPESQIKNKNEEMKKNILAFEGEYLNGKKWNGKIFDKN